jgi:hypothetical protein
MRKLASHPDTLASTAVNTTASAAAFQLKSKCAFNRRFYNNPENTVARMAPMNPATTPSARNSTENIRIT